MLGLEEKRYPSVLVQSVFLGTSILHLQTNGINPWIMISMGLVFTLFGLQAVSPRFFYYFPSNSFAQSWTYHWDTVILYAMTVFALVSLMLGIFQAWYIALITTIVIIGFPVFWRLQGFWWIKKDLAQKLEQRGYQTLITLCPCCRGALILKTKVLEWNLGIEGRLCLDSCGFEEIKFVEINIG